MSGDSRYSDYRHSRPRDGPARNLTVVLGSSDSGEVAHRCSRATSLSCRRLRTAVRLRAGRLVRAAGRPCR
ncbi:hypothetical protein ACFPM0_10430 [Pseudonocardia sulfidoxydans]|uniref:hypothetical protein n=1 Tax=Pseudonocardia sulfidoxydans TaxID=54011 RepID=UPI00360F4417